MEDRRQANSKDVLSSPQSFPNSRAAAQIDLLVGLDHHIDTLTRDLTLIFDPQLIENWSQDTYGKQLPIVQWVKDSVPLIVFQGDVGTGKTALAEVIGQRVAERGGFGVHLVKMNTRVRGTGYVGEMGTLIATSFQEVKKLWQTKGEPVLFLIDEADSVLTTREAAAHHHEDKSGVNTILQHLDEFRTDGAQVAVIAITNRGAILDPAIRRRATSVLTFTRPDEKQCASLLKRLFGGALAEKEIAMLSSLASGPDSGKRQLAFTYSDLTLRFAIPAARHAAWSGEKLDVNSLMHRLKELTPTPSMSDLHEPSIQA